MVHAPGAAGGALVGIIGVLTLPPPAPAFLTVRQADRYASPTDVVASSVSADGRFVAFASFARLVPADTNERRDIYVLDRANGTVTLESPPADVGGIEHDSVWPRISGDGRFLVYEAMQERQDRVPLRVIALRDRWRATTQILQRGAEPPDRNSREPAISSDGRVVVFSTCATNIGRDMDINGIAEDVYAFEPSTGRFELINVDTTGRQPLVGASFAASLSADGRYVAFTSTSDLDSSDAARGPRINVANVYLRDTKAHVTSRISVGRDGGAANGPSYGASLSGDSRYVAFVSAATNLVPRDGNRFPDVFLRDVQAGTTLLISSSASGGSANAASRNPAIATNGNYIAFQSDASDLTCGGKCSDGTRDINLVSDVFLFDRVSRSMSRISIGRQPWMEPSAAPAISGTGQVVTFSSRHPVDANDTGNDFDLFVSLDQTMMLTYSLKAR